MPSLRPQVARILLAALASFAAASLVLLAIPLPRAASHRGTLWHFNTHG